MKFLGLFVIAICLGTSSAGLFSKLQNTVSDTTKLAKNTVSSVTNTVTNTVSDTTKLAKNTVNTATNVAKNTVEAAAKTVSTGAINTGIEVLLTQARMMVKATGNRNLHIPDVVLSKGPLHFNATGGFFRDISTLKQTTKPNITMNGTSFMIGISVKLTEIDVGYENFTVSSWKLKAGGGIRIHISNDTFVIHLRLKPGINCALNVEKVDVTEFGGIEVDFTNMGSKSEWFLEKVSSLLVKFLKENIKKQVQTAVDSALRKALKENGSICSKFLG